MNDRDNIPDDVLDRYWVALEQGNLSLAAEIRREAAAEYAALRSSFQLLDELLVARALATERHE